MFTRTTRSGLTLTVLLLCALTCGGGGGSGSSPSAQQPTSQQPPSPSCTPVRRAVAWGIDSTGFGRAPDSLFHTVSTTFVTLYSNNNS